MCSGNRTFPLLFASTFYTTMVGAALLWGYASGRPNVFVYTSTTTMGRALWGLLFGGVLGGLLVVAGRGLERFQWSRKLYQWFASLLGPVGWTEAFVLAGLSAFGEELLFRGAMQPALGLGWTSVAFMLVHLPPRLDLIWWTLIAGALGAIFGLGTELSGNLAFAIAAHFTINILNLKRISHYGPPAQPS